MNEPHHLNEAISRVVETIRPLAWTDQLYGRAHDIQRQTAGMDRPLLVPMIYTGAGEYIDARPNDDAASVAFFRVRESEKGDFDRAVRSPTHRIRNFRDVSLIGWVNLQRLPAYDDNTATLELLKIETKRALKYLGCVTRIGEYQDGLLEEIFKGYMIGDLGKRYGEWPFSAFRLDLTLMTIDPN